METTTAALSVEHIARVCHEANKAYCESIGDNSQKSWEEAEDWQRESAIKGVQFRIKKPGTTPEAQHDAWRADKHADGWVYGPEKNAEAKTHPCMLPYKELPEEQRRKDALFQAVVDSLTDPRPMKEVLSVDTQRKLAWLQCLENAGVDNWDGYSHASDAFSELYPD